MKIFDLSNLTNISEIGQFQEIGIVNAVEVEENLVYIADFRKGLLILNIFDSSNLTVVVNYTNTFPLYDIKIINNLAFVNYSSVLSGGIEEKLILLNVSDPSNIVEIAR